MLLSEDRSLKTDPRNLRGERNSVFFVPSLTVGSEREQFFAVVCSALKEQAGESDSEMREGRETSFVSGVFATVSVSVLDNTAGIVFFSESILARSGVMIDISSSPFDISIPDFSLVCLDREIVYVVMLSGLIVICAELLRVISVTSL